MRVSTFHSDAILRLGGTGLRRTKSPGGAAFEPCSILHVESFGHHGTSWEHHHRSLDRRAEFFVHNVTSGSPGGTMYAARMT
jgi:hypothetical protein